jgi:hypothetical protein
MGNIQHRTPTPHPIELDRMNKINRMAANLAENILSCKSCESCQKHWLGEGGDFLTTKDRKEENRGEKLKC